MSIIITESVNRFREVSFICDREQIDNRFHEPHEHDNLALSLLIIHLLLWNGCTCPCFLFHIHSYQVYNCNSLFIGTWTSRTYLSILKSSSYINPLCSGFISLLLGFWLTIYTLDPKELWWKEVKRSKRCCRQSLQRVMILVWYVGNI